MVARKALAREVPTHPAALPASRRIALAILLVIHGGMAVVATRHVFAAPRMWNDRPFEWALAAATALLLMALAARRWPQHAAAACALGCTAIAALLLGPGTVATVGLIVVVAIVAGTWLLERAAGGATAPPAVAALAGTAVAIGLFAMTVRWRIHFPALHIGLGMLVLILGRRSLRPLASRAWGALAHGREISATERAWTVLLAVVTVVHLIVVAKPEVGYDASTMHLQFPEIIAAERSFRYDVGRYLWASMPLGADYAFATAYLMGGESAARLLNLAFGGLACALVYRLAAANGSREAALACTTLFAAMPIAMLVGGSLFSETLWTAFLLATLVVVVEGAGGRQPVLPALALLAGGAMATKVMSLPWLAVLIPFALWLQWRQPSGAPLRVRGWLVVGIGIAIGAWPYVKAWLDTGNPVFPFMNALFGSPFYDTATSFNNARYNTPLSWRSPWQVVMKSGRFIEGENGAMGLAWLFAYPLIAVAFTMRRTSAQWMMLVLMIAFFAFIYAQQSYLRYLLPAFAVAAVLASIALAGVTMTTRARHVVLAFGIALLALNLRLVGTAHHPNATPCLACSQSASARAEHVHHYAPLRTVSARLNRELPTWSVVGFMVLNAPAPAGYVGTSRSGNWHDHPFFSRLKGAASADEVLALARDYRLTHVVLSRQRMALDDPIAQFARRWTTALWQVDDYVVAAVQPGGGD